MKPFAIPSLALICGLPLQAQEQRQPASNIEKELPIPSSVFIPPPPPKEVPAMKRVASTVLKLPTHQITVLRSAASTLPDIPLPPVPKPSVPGPQGEPRYLLSFGATVYDHSISHVTWHDPRTKEDFEAWCAWDWTLLAPLPNLEIDDRLSVFSLSASNIDSNAELRFGREFKVPEHPQLDVGAFSITKGNEDDAMALKALSVLRDYYFKHKDRLVLIQKAREEYQAAAAAYYSAHPPKPENHTFWLKPHRGSRYLTQEGGR